LRGDIDDFQVKIYQMDSDIEKGEAENDILQKKLNALLVEIDNLKAQAAEHEDTIGRLDPIGGSKIIYITVDFPKF
jgi:peptidoglycan hydrolase CwlO-like protein